MPRPHHRSLLGDISLILRCSWNTIWPTARYPTWAEFLGCKNGKVWTNDRPGLGVSVDEKQLTFIEAMTEAAPGPTHRGPDGALTHW